MSWCRAALTGTCHCHHRRPAHGMSAPGREGATMSTSTRVVDYIVDFLCQQEVRHVFGVGGANIEDLYDAIHHSTTGIQAVVAKHEFSAATMADGYYRASQRIAPIVSTSGAGAMNLVPG